jgi:cytidine deaminase
MANVMSPDHPTIQKMRDLAEAASERAYAPYSGFRVGAAVLSEDGEIFTGANVENASYSLSICAERSAIFQAVSAGKRKLAAVVIFTPTERPTPPCGSCLQVIHEFGPAAHVYSFASSGEPLQATLADLLPHPFDLKSSTE